MVRTTSVRACDSCIRRRARWYCAADDVFLCQNCDSSIHSANLLAGRHDRVRLQTNSISKPDELAPAWHYGFKRKARTPRPAKAKIARPVSSLVPEIGTSPQEGSNGEEEQLLYRVPILAGLLQSDAELAEFSADMESLLGRGLDNDSFSLEELGLIDTKYSTSSHEEIEQVKEENVNPYEEIDMSRETLEINFNCGSADEEQEEAKENFNNRKKIGLRLDYEAIAGEWSVSGSLSPWMNGERPQFGPDDCWLDCMGMWGGAEVQGLVQGEVGVSHLDQGREARVSRYREKRRTRLFSKKIRYEVRKLNAEKRPRMKGRFVKRASFV